MFCYSFFIYPMGRIRVCEINRIHRWFSGDRKIPTRGSAVPVGNKACRVSQWNGGPRDSEHQWLILFLTYHHRIVLWMTPFLFLTMEVSERNERNKKFNQSQAIFVPKCYVCYNKEKTYPHLTFSFTNKGAIDIWNLNRKHRKPTLSDN